MRKIGKTRSKTYFFLENSNFWESLPRAPNFEYPLLVLTYVFNLSLACGEFISDFKTAKVVPIHKKGSVTNVYNFVQSAYFAPCQKYWKN